jgi:hypothetical protein
LQGIDREQLVLNQGGNGAGQRADHPAAKGALARMQAIHQRQHSQENNIYKVIIDYALQQKTYARIPLPGASRLRTRACRSRILRREIAATSSDGRHDEGTPEDAPWMRCVDAPARRCGASPAQTAMRCGQGKAVATLDELPPQVQHLLGATRRAWRASPTSAGNNPSDAIIDNSIPMRRLLGGAPRPLHRAGSRVRWRGHYERTLEYWLAGQEWTEFGTQCRKAPNFPLPASSRHEGLREDLRRMRAHTATTPRAWPACVPECAHVLYGLPACGHVFRRQMPDPLVGWQQE